MEKINVLHLNYSLKVGGAEKVIYHYVDLLRRDPVLNPIVCAIKERGPIADDISNLGVKVFDLRSRNKFISFLKLVQLIIREDIRIIHAHNPVPNVFGVPAALLTGFRKIIRTEHNVFYDGRVGWYYPALNAVLGIFNYRILAVSDMVRNTHVKKDPFSRKKYITLYNGIRDPDIESANDRSQYCELFGIDQNAKVVGKVASLTEQKGHSYFVEIADLLLKEFNNLYFLLIGDGPLRKDIERDIRARGIQEKVILTGIRKDVPALLRFIDVFVLSSLWEGFPMTIIEAMAAAKPVVVTDVGGNREAVVHGTTGYLVPPSDARALASSVRTLLLDEGLASRMGKEGRERFEREFTADKMVKKTRELYLSALGMEQASE
jgi:glycosyltransferase involved in cell wall biosynthesis